MTLLNYQQLPGLEKIYLEDSYVLGIEESEKHVKFSLELVLTEKHVAYTDPKPGEQYCYRNAFLHFENVSKANWIRKEMMSSTDAAGEIDYGNIDTMTFTNGVYHLAGDWGEVEITSSKPKIDFID
ncbi:MAG: hypothetical protein F6K00_02435 [Leptolyngbya sp. SIOISBB]|nr:hypothetical protein [Leptolyngbya sp. SIOISBB]